ncbi:MAG: YhfC family intramembrane metalloprotease [Chloroflexi bacterium]|nr:YhfC family intramembrane metalloprotease [Chloroflexota bacterium]
MKRWFAPVIMAGIALMLLVGCGPAGQPFKFDTPPWSDGEVTVYDVLSREGATLGSTRWSWSRGADGVWTQAYELTMTGRHDRGEVVLDADLRPLRSWREMSGSRLETIYGVETITISRTAADGKITSQELKRPADAVDNEISLQAQRALPLAAGYATRYTDVIPATGLTAPIQLRVTGAETLTVPAGTFATWRTVMSTGPTSHDAWYGQAAPYPLVKYVNRSSGATFVLRSISQAGAAAPVAPTAAAAAPAGPPALNVGLLVAAFAVQYPLMLILPILLGWRLRRRYGVSWAIFGVGALTFIASQVVHLPLNWALGLLGGGRGVALWPLAAMALVAGLSSGVCEEGARWLVLRFFLKRTRGWRPALQFGAGHGAAEAIIFGLLALLTTIQMLALRSLDLTAVQLPGATADQVRAALAQFWGQPWYMPAVAGLERVFALMIHVALAVLVMRSFTHRNLLYLAAAIGVHTAVNTWAVWAMRTVGALWVEVGVAVMALALLWLTSRLHDKPAEAAAVAAETSAPTAADLKPVALTAEELARRADASRYQ